MVIPEPEDAVDGVLKPKRVRHGEGRFQDGDNVYVGSFHEDLFDGNGTFMFASGSTYAGTWKQGQYCGQVKANHQPWPINRPTHVQASDVYRVFCRENTSGLMDDTTKVHLSTVLRMDKGLTQTWRAGPGVASFGRAAVPG